MKSPLPIVLLGLAGIGAVVLLNKKQAPTAAKPATSVDQLSAKAQGKVAPIQAKAQSYVDKAREEARSFADKLKTLGV
jgi:hypothetical protein